MLTPSMFKASFPERHPVQNVACEQALQGTRATGREKEREPATSSLEFEYRKSWCGVLSIGRDDISNDVITLGVCFHMFSNVFLLHSHSLQLHTEWQKSDSSVERDPPWNSNSRDIIIRLQALLHFLPRWLRALESLLAGY